MAQIRIHVDGTFESLSAKAVDLKVLRKDLSIARKIDGLRGKASKLATSIKAAQAKKSATVGKLRDQRAAVMTEIKTLITTLSSKSHANLSVISKKYHKHQQAKVSVTPVKVVREPKNVQDHEKDPHGAHHVDKEVTRLTRLVDSIETAMTRQDNIIRNKPTPAKLSVAQKKVKALGKELQDAKSELKEARHNQRRVHD